MLWIYRTNGGSGPFAIGTVEQTSDRGGTDVTYYFRSLDGVLTVRSNLAHTNDARALYGMDEAAALDHLATVNA